MQRFQAGDRDRGHHHPEESSILGHRTLQPVHNQHLGQWKHLSGDFGQQLMEVSRILY